jgi:hypothetical protein
MKAVSVTGESIRIGLPSVKVPFPLCNLLLCSRSIAKLKIIKETPKGNILFCRVDVRNLSEIKSLFIEIKTILAEDTTKGIHFVIKLTDYEHMNEITSLYSHTSVEVVNIKL